MAIWEKATETAGNIEIDGTGPDWVRVLSPSFRTSGVPDTATIGFGVQFIEG